jgi:hypothetical protein
MNFFGIDGHQFAAYFGSVLRLHKERQEDENNKKEGKMTENMSI